MGSVGYMVVTISQIHTKPLYYGLNMVELYSLQSTNYNIMLSLPGVDIASSQTRQHLFRPKDCQ